MKQKNIRHKKKRIRGKQQKCYKDPQETEVWELSTDCTYLNFSEERDWQEWKKDTMSTWLPDDSPINQKDDLQKQMNQEAADG